MGLFYNVSAKKLLDIRKDIFVDRGVRALKMNGFERSPYKGELFGRSNLGDYTYSFCRLNAKSHL